MRRLATLGAAALICALAICVTSFAIAVAPAGELMRSLWGADSGFCSPDWVEWAQVLPAVMAAISGSAALFMAARRGLPSRPPGPYLAWSVFFLAVWLVVGALGDCGLASDDG